jgi:hypothetical protein
MIIPAVHLIGLTPLPDSVVGRSPRHVFLASYVSASADSGVGIVKIVSRGRSVEAKYIQAGNEGICEIGKTGCNVSVLFPLEPLHTHYLQEPGKITCQSRRLRARQSGLPAFPVLQD